MAYDIRTGQHGEVDTIKFAPLQQESERDHGEYASTLLKADGDDVVLVTEEGDGLNIYSEEDAEFLIKALQFAIDNGWWK